MEQFFFLCRCIFGWAVLFVPKHFQWSISIGSEAVPVVQFYFFAYKSLILKNLKMVNIIFHNCFKKSRHYVFLATRFDKKYLYWFQLLSSKSDNGFLTLWRFRVNWAQKLGEKLPGVHDPSLIKITPVQHNGFRNKFKHEKLKIELTNRRETRMVWSTKISYIWLRAIPLD